MPKSGQNPNIDDDTRSRARRFAADAGMPKPAVNRPFVAPAKAKAEPKPKQRVVSKKELEESGLSLRDFLNRERGLTRRPDKADSKVESAKKQIMRGKNPSAEEIEAAKKQIMRGENPSAEDIAKAKKQLGIGSSSKLDPEATSRNNAPRRKPEPLSSVRKPGTNINYENTDSYDMSMKRGGKVKAYAKGGMTRGDGICVKGKTKGKFV